MKMRVRRGLSARMIALFMSVIVFAATVSLAVLAHAATIVRVAGSDRYQTAIATSKRFWSNGTAPVSVLVTGKNWPDALSAGPLAGCYGGPVLLVNGSVIPAGLMDELKRLGTKRVIIVGGTSVVGSGVDAYMKARGISVTRIAGSDRYNTSVGVSNHMRTLADSDSRAYLASGEGFNDALLCLPYASLKGSPILLTRKGDLPALVKAELRNYSNVRVVTTNTNISLAVYNAIPITKTSGQTTPDTAKLLHDADGSCCTCSEAHRW